MHIYRAVVRSFNPATWQADVELAGAHTALLAGVPVAGDLGPALLAQGSKVWVCLSEEGNPADGAVLVPYGAPPSPWVTSRLLRPALVSAERLTLLACNSTSFVTASGFSVTLTVEVTSTVVLMLAAIGYLSNVGITYFLSFYHDDAHESTQLTPVQAVGGVGAGCNTFMDLTWLGLQTGVAAGTHTYVLKHRVSGGQANLQSGRIVAIATG